ncbi:S8 family peptidase [Nocardioides rubriscoriae]|uniref:S8 family peptidase n=1 Tax=Nocardioides rubriscoriae TaxID=642762 RepID=UPI0011DF530C|nr:S8/S53 family peptidase [Nocardioides rubriscoriae]
MTRPSDPSGSSTSLLSVLRSPWRLVTDRVPWPWSPQEPPTRTPDELDRAIQQAQLAILLAAFGHGRGARLHEGERDDDVYLYRPGRLLVRSEDLDRVLAFFAERTDRYGGRARSRQVVDGLHHVLLPRRAEVPAVLPDLEAELGDDVARPDHVLYVTPGQGGGRMCPADEPRPPRRTRPLPEVAERASAGKGVRVSVVDTGWWEPAETTGLSPWLHDVDGDAEVIDQHAIHPYAGHGTFVAGVVRCLAPAVGVEVEGFLTHGGAAYESAIVRELDEAVVETFDPHVISISAGTYTRHDRGLLAFDVFASTRRLLDGEGDLLVVAAAGNDSTTRPFWPAAYDWAVGVGALDPDGQVCDFSNTGSWVDVYALGRDLVNAYPAGTYTCQEPPHVGTVRHFKGLAQWSGTSFATPVVSGAIAAHMSATGRTAHESVTDLLAAGRPLADPHGNPITAVGPPFA